MTDTTNKTFCVLPWIHTHIWSDGKVFPCCMGRVDRELANYRDEESLPKLLHSPRYLSLRTRMLKGEQSEECEKCYALEASGGSSLRIDSNQRYSHLAEEIQRRSDPKFFALRFLDIRFSNACNLACVTCSPAFSSRLYRVHQAMGKHLPPSEILSLNIYENLEPYLLEVTNVNFAGGEPLLNKDHYRILEYWCKQRHFEVQINYTTNMTSLNFQNYRVLDYWRQFPQISILASLDDYGPRIAEIRRGANWDRIVENLLRIRTEAPHVAVRLSPTVSALNVDRIFAAVRLFYENLKISPADWQVNILQYPHYLSVQTLSREEKERFQLEFQEYKSWLVRLGLDDRGAFLGLKRFLECSMSAGNFKEERETFLMEFDSAYQRVYPHDLFRGETAL